MKKEEQRQKMASQATSDIDSLKKTCTESFKDIYSTFTHIKFLKVIIDSQMRFGSPEDYLVLLISAAKGKEKRIHTGIIGVFAEKSKKGAASLLRILRNQRRPERLRGFLPVCLLADRPALITCSRGVAHPSLLRLDPSGFWQEHDYLYFRESLKLGTGVFHERQEALFSLLSLLLLVVYLFASVVHELLDDFERALVVFISAFALVLQTLTQVFECLVYFICNRLV